MTNDKKELLKRAAARIMLPLVRLLLSQGVTYGEFATASKALFFEAGRSIARKENLPDNASQLSILTGLHRKDVTTFLQESSAPRLQGAGKTSVGAAIIATWISDPAYRDMQGAPRVLPYSAEDPKIPSFTALVAGISKDMRPKPYLEEMMRLNIVTQDGAGNVALRRDAFIPSDDFSSSLRFLERTAGDHLSAAAANVESGTPIFPDRCAFHASLPPETVLAIESAVRTDGMDFLKKIYLMAEESAGRTVQKKDGSRRMTVGIYMYHEEESHEKND